VHGHWAPYAELVASTPSTRRLLFDRFHMVQHLHEAVDAARLELWRQPTSKKKTTLKATRWLLKNPWNCKNGQQERLSTLARWNSPLVRAGYLKESFQMLWTYKQPGARSSICSIG
jgi:transposase